VALAGVTSKAKRDLYEQRVCGEFALDVGPVRAALQRSLERSQERAARPARPGADPGGGAPGEPRRERRPPPELERQLVMALLAVPRLLDEFRERLGPESLGHEGCRRLTEELILAAEEGPVVAAAVAGRLADPDDAALAADLLADASQRPGLERQGRDCIERLARSREHFALLEGFQRAPDADREAEFVRRLQGHHARRAGGLGEEHS
jgi:hypothetical protein